MLGRDATAGSGRIQLNRQAGSINAGNARSEYQVGKRRAVRSRDDGRGTSGARRVSKCRASWRGESDVRARTERRPHLSGLDREPGRDASTCNSRTSIRTGKRRLTFRSVRTTTSAPAPFGPDARPAHAFPAPAESLAVHGARPEGFRDEGDRLDADVARQDRARIRHARSRLRDGRVPHAVRVRRPGRSAGRKPPTVQVEGPKERTVKVGQPTPLVAVATDGDSRRPGRAGAAAEDAAGATPRHAARARSVPATSAAISSGGPPRACGVAWLRVPRSRGTRGDSADSTLGAADAVTFDPPIPFKVWEDQRGG